MKKDTKAAGVVDEQIAVRAYERWLGRGCPVSDGADDWFAARRELEAERNPAAGRRTVPPRKTAAKNGRAIL